MAGFLYGVGQVSDVPKSGAAPKLGASDVNGTASAPAAGVDQSDPMSQLVQMRSVAQVPTAASAPPVSGLLQPPPTATTTGAPPQPSYGPTSNATALSAGQAASAGNITNPTQWAQAELQVLGDPESAANINSLVQWAGREGGNWHNTAAYNPLNTTQNYDGSTVMGGGNSAGVQAYKSWLDGLNATATTLENGRYGDLLAALKAGSGLGSGHYAGLGTWSGGGYYSI